MSAERPTYNPQSYFFVDYTALALANEDNKSTDSYGPIMECPEEQFRTTSFVRASNIDTPVKVYAICNGEILIQPMKGSEDKVNLILKPSTNYTPLKIKYFIYRGVRKSDLLNQNSVIKIDDSNTIQPDFLKNLWKVFERFNGISSITDFPASLIGYEESETTLLDKIFSPIGTGSCQLPPCSAGTHLGYFTDRIGLDIVLDNGEYQLEHQQELFHFDLEYAQKQEQVFNILDITNSNTTIESAYRKRFKECVLKFLDACSFWGSHIDTGKIYQSVEQLKTAEQIYNLILSKYQTKNVIYLHISEYMGRSYTYYDTSTDKRKSLFELSESERTLDDTIPLEEYGTSGWPIVCISSIVNNNKLLYGYLQYDTPNIEDNLYRLILNEIGTNYIYYGGYSIEGNITAFYFLPIFTSDNNLCSTFIILNCNLKEYEYSLYKYHNSMWAANVIPAFNIPETMGCTGCTYDKSSYISLNNEYPSIGAIIQNKVVFDTGINQSLIPVTKKRRLFIAGIKSIIENNGVENRERNVTDFASFFDVSPSYATYIQYLYNDNLKLIKDTFIDDNDKIYSLRLTNSKSFFQLGITEEEYNSLIYNNQEIPNPPVSQHLPEDADNVFFYLNKIAELDGDIIKFELGIRYEDNTGQTIPQALFPTNPIYVYSCDGFYFFSKDFSSYQHLFYERHSALFYPTNSYSGDFGFDWMREGETFIAGDVAYRDIMGKLKQYNKESQAYDIDVTDGNVYQEQENKIRFMPETGMFKNLETEYNPFSVKIDDIPETYYPPMLAIYPYCDKNTDPEPILDELFRTEFGIINRDDYDYSTNRVAQLTLKITIAYDNEPTKLYLDYDNSLFDIALTNEYETTIDTDDIPICEGIYKYNVTIKCKTEFDTEKEIKVTANYTDATSITIGSIRVKPNAQALRRKKNIVIVQVKTNLNGLEKNPNIQLEALNVKKFLRQALITPVFTKAVLNLTSNDGFDDYVYQLGTTKVVLKKNKINSNGDSLIQFLNKQTIVVEEESKIIEESYGDTYIKLFVFDEIGADKDETGSYTGLGGYSNGNNTVRFKSSDSTASHEILHSLGLRHSFTAKSPQNLNAKYTYRPKLTDNIMDYSEIKTITLWNWQTEFTKEKTLDENSN